MPSNRALPPQLMVAHGLALREKLLLVLSNAAYYAAATAVATASHLPTAPTLECATALCGVVGFHATILFALSTVSTYWHGAQCQLCPSLYCYSSELDGARLHTPTWLRRLFVADISCATATFGVGIICFGLSRTVSWLAVPLLVFVLGAMAKRRRLFRLYALAHSAWHVLSALAISQIVLNDQALTTWMFTSAHA